MFLNTIYIKNRCDCVILARFMRSFFLVVLFSSNLSATKQSKDSVRILLSNVQIQIEATQAINDMYNFKFQDAERQFRWIRQRHPEHPLPYYLLGLSQWWKILPNLDETQYDDEFLSYMNLAIEKAEILHENPETQLEASFFLAAGYAMKGRLYSDRGSWGKAANSGRLALKYQRESDNMHDLSPEFMFGDALYNYYSVWIRENYPLLRPIMIAFKKGNKQLGIDQLRIVANNAFYTRTEAQLYLMRILALDENDTQGALQISEYLYKTYPDNPYFHRFYARLLYQTGQRRKMEQICIEIMHRIDLKQPGYEANSGRYAGFFLGQYYEGLGRDEDAKMYYELAINFAEKIKAFESGYYLFSLLHLAKMYEYNDEDERAEKLYRKIRKYAKKKNRASKESKAGLKRLKKKRKLNR